MSIQLLVYIPDLALVKSFGTCSQSNADCLLKLFLLSRLSREFVEFLPLVVLRTPADRRAVKMRSGLLGSAAGPRH